MWAEIENGLSCQFFVPSVRFSVRKVKVKKFKLSVLKTIIIPGSGMYSYLPEGRHVPSSLHALISSVNESKQTLLILIPFRHEKREMTLKGYLHSWVERYYEYKGILCILLFVC